MKEQILKWLGRPDGSCWRFFIIPWGWQLLHQWEDIWDIGSTPLCVPIVAAKRCKRCNKYLLTPAGIQKEMNTRYESTGEDFWEFYKMHQHLSWEPMGEVYEKKAKRVT